MLGVLRRSAQLPSARLVLAHGQRAPQFYGPRFSSGGTAGAAAAPSSSPSIAVDATSDAVTPIADSVAAISDAAASAPVSPAEIGYFQSVGLAESWVSPTGFFQHVFEYVHVYTGLPWWATILGVTVATRLLMAPLYVSSSDTAARMARIKPELNELLERTKQTSDPAAMQRALLDRRALLQKSGIKILNMGKPLLSVPVFLGYFNALRGMAHVPVDGFQTQGLAWFSDLAAADPVCGLQLLTAAFYAGTFRYLGGETGATVSPVMKKVFTYMPFVAVPLTMTLPASVCFYFAINAVWAVFQSLMLKSPRVRAWLQIAPLVTPAEQAAIDARLGPAAQNDSIIAAFRKKYEDARDDAQRRMEEETKKKQKHSDYFREQESQYIQFRKKS